MRIGLLSYALVVAGCYHPEIASDVPCSPDGTCPPPQFCDTAAMPPTCVRMLHDAAPPIDANLVWATPQPIDYAPTGSDDDPTLTGDMLELYFNRANDIYVTARKAVGAPWQAPHVVAELSTTMLESTPEIAPDGLTIYFSSNRTGSAGVDIWRSTRATRDSTWDIPVLVPELESPSVDRCATPNSDPNVLVMASNRGGLTKFDMYISKRESVTAWSTPVLLTGPNTDVDDTAPMLSSDGLSLYFFSARSGNSDLYVAHRAAPTGDFDAGTPIAEINTSDNETDPWLSPDGHHLVFARNSKLFETSR